uniref:Uncharacterized protein n=1 Tax=Ranid herpesvirus 4 TaxID=2849006 RepID=A0A8F3HSY6_9VIRU|nr:MAG: hypothetical protein [Ranid herpesvirus 4]
MDSFDKQMTLLSDDFLEVRKTKQNFYKKDKQLFKNKLLFWSLLNDKGVLSILAFGSVDPEYLLNEPCELKYYSTAIKEARKWRAISYWIGFVLAIIFYVSALLLYGICFTKGVKTCPVTLCYIGFIISCMAICGSISHLHNFYSLHQSMAQNTALPTSNLVKPISIINLCGYVLFISVMIFYLLNLNHIIHIDQANSTYPNLIESVVQCDYPVITYGCVQISIFIIAICWKLFIQVKSCRVL